MLSSLILCTIFNRIVTCDGKWILYDNQQWLAQELDREEALKHLPKPNLYEKEIVVTGGLLPVECTTAYWIPAKPLHLRSMLSKLMRCIKNCNYCSQHWSTERAQFFSTTTINQCFKSWTNWATEFWLIGHIHLTSHQPSITSSRILTTFCSKNASTTSRKEKMLSKTS